MKSSFPLFYRIIAPLNLLLGIVAAITAVICCFEKEAHLLIPYLSIGTVILLGSSFCWFFTLPFARGLLFLTAVLLLTSVAAGNYCLLRIFEKNEPNIIIIEISVVLIVYALFCLFAAFSKSAIAWEKESIVPQSKVKEWMLVVLPSLLLFVFGFWVLYELSTKKPKYESHENENYEEIATVDTEDYATPDTVRAIDMEDEEEEGSCFSDYGSDSCNCKTISSSMEKGFVHECGFTNLTLQEVYDAYLNKKNKDGEYLAPILPTINTAYSSDGVYVEYVGMNEEIDSFKIILNYPGGVTTLDFFTEENESRLKVSASPD